MEVQHPPILEALGPQAKQFISLSLCFSICSTKILSVTAPGGCCDHDVSIVPGMGLNTD